MRCSSPSLLRRHLTPQQKGWVAGCVASVALLSAPQPTRAQAVPAARGSLHAVMQENPRAHAQWRLGQPAPSLITGLRIPTAGVTPEHRAQNFVATHAGLIGVPAAELSAQAVQSSAGRVSVRFQQVYRGLPVYQRSLVVTMDTDGNVITLNNSTLPITQLGAPRLSLERALTLAHAQTKRASGNLTTSAPERVIIAQPGHAAEAALVRVAHPGTLQSASLLVDLSTGAIRSLRSGVQQ